MDHFIWFHNFDLIITNKKQQKEVNKSEKKYLELMWGGAKNAEEDEEIGI